MPHRNASLGALVLFVSALPTAAQTVRDVPAAYPDIQSAIVAAAPGDTVRVAPGTYPETIDFLGKAITVLSAEGPEVTAIDAGGAGTVVTFASGEGPGSVLEGFRVTGGDAGANDGGGVLCVGTAPVLRNCWIRFNLAANGAGLRAESGASVLLEDCLFEDNLASGYGGALDVFASAVTLLDGTLRDNEAGLHGGGVAVFQGSLLVTGGTFVENSAGGEGGAVSLNQSSGRIESAGLWLNRADVGGAIAVEAGAGIVITGCKVGRNTATTAGGGLWFSNTDPTLASSTVADNTAGSGGGLYVDDADPLVVNTILWANGGDLVTAGTATPTVRHSVVLGGWPGVGNLSAEPQFTSFPGGSFRLLPTSPCVDAGDPAAPELPLEDFDGQPRVAGAAVDIGADESHPEPGVWLERFGDTDLRVLVYNVWNDAIFPSTNPAQAAKFARLVASLDPDVLCLQEVGSSAASVQALMDQLAPLGGTSWSVHAAPQSQDVIASKYPLSLTATKTIPEGQRDLAMALVDLPDDRFDEDLYLVATHFKCCGGALNDSLRQEQADAIVAWLRDARTPGGSIDLPAGTPIAVVGDLNIVESFQPVSTLLNGDIVEEASFGPDAAPDWDGTPNADLRPRHNGRERFDWTWRDDGGSFGPGRLDYVTITDSVLRTGNAFALNTALLSPAELTAAGLSIWDVTIDQTGVDYDHLPLVFDARAELGPVRSFGSGCGGLAVGWRGTAGLGASVDLFVHGAEPLRPTTLSVGFSKSAWLGVPLPLDLGIFGAEGCQLLVEPKFNFTAPADAAGRRTVTWNLPVDPTLVGAVVYVQWASTAGDPSEWRFSEGLELTILP